MEKVMWRELLALFLLLWFLNFITLKSDPSCTSLFCGCWLLLSISVVLSIGFKVTSEVISSSGLLLREVFSFALLGVWFGILGLMLSFGTNLNWIEEATKDILILLHIKICGLEVWMILVVLSFVFYFVWPIIEEKIQDL
jgi:hypothetical protein